MAKPEPIVQQFAYMRKMDVVPHGLMTWDEAEGPAMPVYHAMLAFARRGFPDRGVRIAPHGQGPPRYVREYTRIVEVAGERTIFVTQKFIDEVDS